MAGRRWFVHRSAGETRLHSSHGVPHVRIRRSRCAQSCRGCGRSRHRSARARDRVSDTTAGNMKATFLTRAGRLLRRNPYRADPRPAIVATVILAVMLLLAIMAPLVAPYGFDVLDLANRRAAPSSAHWFGTDELGRDLLTR